MTNLTKIANKCGTDKGTEHFEKHGYTEEYSKYIPETGNYTLLEIGVWHCESLRMWEDYNPDMSINGIEITPGWDKWYRANDSFNVYTGDATNPDTIEKIINEIGSPDFIIDDGSHRYEDILATFKLLYPELKSGGYYFIEDLHAPQARKEDLVHGVLKELNKGFKLDWVCNNKLLIINKS